jgi:hypothetical protein
MAYHKEQDQAYNSLVSYVFSDVRYYQQNLIYVEALPYVM